MLERRGCTVVVRNSLRPGDAERLARAAEPEFEVVVAAGGDGTANAVVNGLAENPRTMAVLPLGTANVLARELGLPRRSEALAELIACAAAQPIWPGRIGDRLFLMMAGIGFDAEVVAAVDSKLKRRIGRLAFLWAILLHVIGRRAGELSVRLDAAEYRAVALIVAKGRFYAGRFVIAPTASLAEPLLDILLFHDSRRIAVLRCLGALAIGVLPRLKNVTRLRARTVRVSADAPVPMHVDGEPAGNVPAEISVAAQPVWLIRP